MSDRISPNHKTICTLILVLGGLFILFATSLSEAKKTGINLPDGLYMYDSRVKTRKSGNISIRFGKFFVVKNNSIYNSHEAIKKMRVSKLNKLFAENKNYKILLGGENIGEIYDLKFVDASVNVGDVNEGDKTYKVNLFAKDIKEGPMYERKSRFMSRSGSAVKCLAVPEQYKEVKIKVDAKIKQKEVDKMSKLVKRKMFQLVKNREEITQLKLKYTEVNDEYIVLLDKISDRNNELYIGMYRYEFIIPKNSRSYRVAHYAPTVEIIFSVKKDNVYVITSDYGYTMKIQGMLDVDGCGEQELIIEKVYGGLDEAITKIEIYKQKTDGNWTLMLENEWRKTS